MRHPKKYQVINYVNLKAVLEKNHAQILESNIGVKLCTIQSS